jgi:hypothetical protein
MRKVRIAEKIKRINLVEAGEPSVAAIIAYRGSYVVVAGLGRKGTREQITYDRAKHTWCYTIRLTGSTMQSDGARR